MVRRSGINAISTFLAVLMLLGVFFIIAPDTAVAAQDGDFTYSISGDPAVATVTGYTGAGGAINIPATLGGYPTIAIGDYAFSTPLYPINSVTIPDSVTSIGVYSFANCNSMASLTIGNNVTIIGHHAFYDCYGLTSLSIPDSVTSIGLAAFYHNALLTSITIGDNVTAIGGGAFIDCISLTHLTIPDSVTSIGFMAFFRCNNLVQVNIGNGVTSIEHEAFSNCTSLATINIPNSVTSIGYGAFSYCPSLASMTIGSGVTSIGYEAFRNCTGLTSISFRGLVAPSAGADWILDTSAGIRGHAYAASNFPAPGGNFYGLIMGDLIAIAPIAPDAPTNLIATPGDAQVVLVWTAPAYDGGSVITAYKVYRGISSGGESLLVVLGNVLTYTDAGLTNGQTYYYKVSAVNSVGESVLTDELSATPNVPSTDNGDNTLLYIGIAVVAILAIAGAAVLMIRKKK